MKIENLIKNKALPSFCTANIDVIKSIMIFCNFNKLPCLIECTSNQVNQYGGYTNKTPKKFIKEIDLLRKKFNIKKNKLFLGADHMGPLPWKNNTSKVAIKNSIKLIETLLNENFCKIHIDTSIRCNDDLIFNNDVIFSRTKEILEQAKIKKKIKNKFLITGSEVPLSGSGDSRKNILTTTKHIKDDHEQLMKIFNKSQLLKNKIFGLVVEPGMKFMHHSIKKPDLQKFNDKYLYSKKNNFVFEAHSTDYQPYNILRKLVENNFKFLKVGPELTYNYSRSLFFMENIEKKLFTKNKSSIKNNIFKLMIKNKKYWISYYKTNKKKILLESKLDRMRYYLNDKKSIESINNLKKNINCIKFNEILNYLSSDQKKEFLLYYKKKLSNFENIKMIFISQSLIRYYSACGYEIN